jgi:hypothetical protein
MASVKATPAAAAIAIDLRDFLIEFPYLNVSSAAPDRAEAALTHGWRSGGLEDSRHAEEEGVQRRSLKVPWVDLSFSPLGIACTYQPSERQMIILKVLTGCAF